MGLSTKNRVILFIIVVFTLIFGFEFGGHLIFDPIFKSTVGVIIVNYLFIFIFSFAGFMGILGLFKRELYSVYPMMLFGPIYRFKGRSSVAMGLLFAVAGFILTPALIIMLFKDLLAKSEYNYHITVLVFLLSLSFVLALLNQKRLKEKLKGKKFL